MNSKKNYSKSGLVSDLNSLLATDINIGLTQTEAQKRLADFGPNEIHSSQLKSRIQEVLKLFLDPMGLMLLGLSALYFFIGDQTDALILLVAWVPVTAVDVILEIKANSALQALKSVLNPTAKVLRDSKVNDILIREIVPGDLLVLEEGQALPADGRLLEAQHLTINESALTGESEPIAKSTSNDFFAGTQILSGRGIGLVQKTASQTRFGQIAKMLADVESSPSPLKKKVDRLVVWVLSIASVLVLILFGLEYYRSGELLKSLIVAFTFGMSAVPEEFPLVFTLYLSLGAWRLAQKKILIKSLPSVEALGSVDILCTDKTGTLTQGRFELEKIWPLDKTASHDLIELCALMACEPVPVDSMEEAISKYTTQVKSVLSDWKLVFDYPFEKLGKHMTHVWQSDQLGQNRTVMKGAVEGVLEHCVVSEAEQNLIANQIKILASQGKRLLGLAMREGGVGDRAKDELELKFLGILVFSDPIRPEVRSAIEHCQSAGIQIKMLTGDHPLTAHYIADEAGIVHSHDLLFSGDDLAKMTPDERHAAFRNGAIFSRVLPEQKHEMIKLLREEGNVVAMIGDGINDAPALKLADIGISMGKTATDVARSSAQIVLVDGDFSGIVDAMLEGRRIFSNMKKSFSYLISFHVPVVLLALIPPFLNWPTLLMPVHIIILELIVHPVSAFTFENLAHKNNSNNKSDRNQRHDLLKLNQVLRAVISGALVSLGSLILYFILFSKTSVEFARSTAFVAVLFGNVVFVANEVLPQISRRFLVTSAFLLVFATLIVFVPLPIFHFGAISWQNALLAMGIGLLGFLPFLLRRRE